MKNVEAFISHIFYYNYLQLSAACRTRYENLLFKMEDSPIPLSIRWEHLRNEFNTENRSGFVWVALMASKCSFLCSVPHGNWIKNVYFILWFIYLFVFVPFQRLNDRSDESVWVAESRRSILFRVLLLTVFSLFFFRWLT